MNRPEPLQSAYDFSCAPEPVSLLDGKVKVHLGNDEFSGTADLQLKFLPAPRVIFRAVVRGTPERELPFLFNAMEDASVTFNGENIEGFSGRWNGNGDALTL